MYSAGVGKVGDRGLRTDQNQTGLGMGVKELAARYQGDGRAVVTTHAINRYRVHAGVTRGERGGAQKPKSPTLPVPHRALGGVKTPGVRLQI